MYGKGQRTMEHCQRKMRGECGSSYLATRIWQSLVAPQIHARAATEVSRDHAEGDKGLRVAQQ